MSGPQGFRRRDGNASDAIAAILHPCMGHREKLKKKGITPVDYERANKLHIKQMQAKNRERQRQEEARQQEAFKLTRFKGVRPKVFSHENAQEGGKKHEFLRRGHVPLTSRDQQQQQTERSEPEASPAEREPARLSTARRPQFKAPVPSFRELVERDAALRAQTERERVDYINSNAWDVIKKSPGKPGAVNVQVKRNRNFGRIPRYLLERKEQWAQEEEERRRNMPDPDCPPGMMLLDEEERLRTLDVLQKSLVQARQQMNALPLRIETPSQIRRKDALEAKLHEIEDAIKVFDRSKVYVPIPLDATSGSATAA